MLAMSRGKLPSSDMPSLYMETSPQPAKKEATEYTTPMDVQSVLFPREWRAAQVHEWLSKKGLKAIRLYYDKNGTHVRARIIDPDEIENFHTVEAGEGIKFIMGTRKSYA